MAIRPTAVSWKETSEDRILKEWVHSHSNVSGFIKDILKKVYAEEMEVKDSNNKSEKSNKRNKLIDLDDF